MLKFLLPTMTTLYGDCSLRPLYGDSLPWLLPMVTAPYHNYSIMTAPYHDCSCYDHDCTTMPVPHYDCSYHCYFLLCLLFKLLLSAMTTPYYYCSPWWQIPTVTSLLWLLLSWLFLLWLLPTITAFYEGWSQDPTVTSISWVVLPWLLLIDCSLP